jgi:hypothetical protein
LGQFPKNASPALRSPPLTRAAALFSSPLFTLQNGKPTAMSKDSPDTTTCSETVHAEPTASPRKNDQFGVPPKVRKAYADHDRVRANLTLVDAIAALSAAKQIYEMLDPAKDAVLCGQIERYAQDMATRLLLLPVDDGETCCHKYAALLTAPYPSSVMTMIPMITAVMHAETKRLGITIEITAVAPAVH